MSDIPVKSVKKAFDLLSILLFEDIGKQGIELSVLATKLGAPVNTTHNLLKSMAACGYVAQTEKSKYISGPKCNRIGMINELKDSRNSSMIDAQVRKLSADIQESVVFTILAGGRRVTINQCDPEEQLIKIDSASFDQNLSIYQMPTGRVLAALASPEELHEIQEYYGSPQALWPTIEEDCRQIRAEHYYAATPDKPEINSYATPVMSPGGGILGALGSYVPVYRTNPEKEALIKENLTKTANVIAMILS